LCSYAACGHASSVGIVEDIRIFCRIIEALDHSNNISWLLERTLSLVTKRQEVLHVVGASVLVLCLANLADKDEDGNMRVLECLKH
jgi:hypothetical protein